MKPDYSFQDRDEKHIRDRFERGVARVLYVLSTGGGKTRVATKVILHELRAGGFAVFIAPKREHVDQAVERLVDEGCPRSKIGVIMAGDARENLAAPIQVASKDTLLSRLRGGKLSRPKGTLIVLDEGHHSVSKGWTWLREYYSRAKVLGLTATPYRLDGKGLDIAFDQIIEGPSMEELFVYGVLVPPRAWSHDEEVVKAALKGSGASLEGPEARAELSKKLGPLIGSVVKQYRKHGDNLPAIVFAIGIEHARKIQAEFRRAGFKVEHLDQSTSIEDRAAILARMVSGETQIITNCEILIEGWDCPPAKVAILARPTKSCRIYMQMVGRMLRPWKRHVPRIIDHAGNVLRFGMPQWPRTYTLEGGLKKGPGKAPFKTCPEDDGGCGAVCPIGCKVCPDKECGYEFPIVTERGVMTPGELAEVTRLREVEMQAVRVAIEKVAKANGANSKWVEKRLTERFA